MDIGDRRLIKMKKENINIYWAIAYWTLLAGSVIGVVLNMNRVRGGFLTNYLADVAFPPWYYIYIRGLWPKKERLPRLILFGDWFGRSPERASISIFAVGTAMELSTIYWPHGLFAGTYDPWDIIAYSLGLLICYYFDKRTQATPAL